MKKRVHFMGIGGSGASAVAAIAKSQGFEVSGCDINLNSEFVKDFDLTRLTQGHSTEHLKEIDILAVSPAIESLDPRNQELLAAKRSGIEVLTWQEFMGKYLEEGKFVIAVCGTHGKSTTTAMIAKILVDAGLDPTVELGAVIPEWGTNYRVGKSKYFITEADEFNDNFLSSKPDFAVVTTVEMDHPEYFKDFDAVKSSFENFLSHTKGTIVANISDPGVGEVIKWVMKSSGVEVIDYSRSEHNLNLRVVGKHNLMNAQAAFQVGLLLGIEPQIIRESLNNFLGIGRRMERIGVINEAEVFSDFGHHPTEIKVTIDALKEKFPNKRVWLIFQPHMFSRTKALFGDFVKVLKDAPIDGAIILDIYPSREVDTGIIHSKELVKAVNKPGVEYVEDIDGLMKSFKTWAGKDDVILFMGAGDIDKIARRVVEND